MWVIRNRFYGDNSVINLACSRAIFWVLNRRRAHLEKRYQSYNPATATNNKSVLQLELGEYLNRGIDKLNLGGGNKSLRGFVNIDFQKGANVARQIIADALDLSFVPDQSISHIHSNHFVEHLNPAQLDDQLREYYRMLKLGGRISLRAPNALGVCYGFFFGPVPETGRDKFLANGYPEDEVFFNKADGWYAGDLYGLYHWLYAFTGNKLNQHLSQLTPTTLASALRACGFEILCQTAPEASNLIIVAQKRRENAAQ